MKFLGREMQEGRKEGRKEGKESHADS